MKKKTNRSKFDQSQAIEQFEQYKETGKGTIIKLKENHGGYSAAYSEGWTRIFGKKEEVVEESDEDFTAEDYQDGTALKP